MGGIGPLTATERDLLARLVDESGRTSSVQLPGSFARDPARPSDAAPLRQLVGRGSVALKLYLSLVMATAKPPYEIRRTTSPARYALMFGLDRDEEDSASAGTRRVQRALNQLVDLQLIQRVKRPGFSDLITVGLEQRDLSVPYISLPIELWRYGWINRMDVPTLAVYVALRHWGKGKDEPFHVTPAHRREYLTESTWTKGLKGLKDLQLIVITKGTPDDGKSMIRRRDIYQLAPEHMKVFPGESALSLATSTESI